MRSDSVQSFFSFGFRPFFLGAAIWAVITMVIWIGMLSGALTLPTAFDPASWHAHAFLFGYLGAVLGGFMMTAVPNWTGRAPIAGWPLAILFAVWIAGRIAVAMSATLSPAVVAVIDLSFPILLLVSMAREIIAGGNWRNLIILVLLFGFICANALFHLEAARGEYAANGLGLRIGVGVAIMMISVIGGRIIPAFTRNWLKKQDARVLPVQPMQPFDKVALLVLLMALICWLALPESLVTGVALLVAGALHLVRLSRWAGMHTFAEPLVWILHAGYAFVPLGALAQGGAILWPDAMDAATAQHLWMAGGIGVMTLAVMTRATLGHTGRALTASIGCRVLYLCILGSVLARVVAGIVPNWAMALWSGSGLLWIAAFTIFSVMFAPMMLRARKEG